MLVGKRVNRGDAERELPHTGGCVCPRLWPGPQANPGATMGEG